MAAIAKAAHEKAAAEGFFRTLAIVMALTIVAAFTLQFARGFSTLAARPLVHVHGLAFMGWVGLFVLQSWFATRGPMALHRTIGRLGAGLVVVLVIMGCWITIDMVQRGTAPFFFKPQHFLIGNPLTVFVFAALTWVAVRLRKQTDWHARLHICAMAAIMGPAFGRLLPMPFIKPYAFEWAVLAALVFPLAGMIRDRRRDGRVHRAWWWGVLPIVAALPVAQLIAHSGIGEAIYAAVTGGHPGAALPGLQFPPEPPFLR